MITTAKRLTWFSKIGIIVEKRGNEGSSMARGKYEKPRARTNVNWKLIGLGLLVVVVCLAIYFIAFTPKDNEPGTMSAPSTTAPTAPPETQPTEPPEPYVTTTASVGVTGDVLMHSAVFNSAHVGNGEYDFNEIFTYISDYYKQYDFMVANM